MSAKNGDNNANLVHNDARKARETLFEVTPEQQEWFRLAGFDRMQWQRLIFTRWRYQTGDLTEDPEGLVTSW